ncbi:efflux transporter, outer membrane factor (OMF) lipoprotein, NodT family [Duganella sp. CF517]|uniref:efflux transporter outer membrane subunit n=1 Tax=Duganella sp. CF517 TaxID=1881038 RepID=UPI0008B1330E|nr:efflux transporter outer membrane subunit [Duganella sp. CF517]SEN88040.1 efflux transporter, outer membrane factor (OMF) lipoprotein, NodT family [Duganella sp. CF517]
MRSSANFKLCFRRPFWRAPWLGAGAALMAGCATSVPAPAPGGPAAPVAAQWHAPLPHGGRLADLGLWWERFDDPLVPRLIAAGQQASPTLAEALARIADARAASVASGAALLPTLGANASASRGRAEIAAPVGQSASAGLQAGWELDLFGANRAGAAAAQAALESSQAGWHVARVSLAADIATSYVSLRACEAQLAQTELDARSRNRTSALTSLAADAGFRAPAVADLARASAAQAGAALIQQRAQCDLSVKALAALTAWDEAALRGELADGAARLPQPPDLTVDAVPAAVLAQRPDIHAAARDVVAASARADQARAQRWPRVTLAGSIGAARARSDGVGSNGGVWSVGPVAVTLPLFDGGALRANAQAARVRYDAATTVYAARLREAVRGVETALVTLRSAAARGADTDAAAAGFERSYHATQAGYEAGTASLFELEDARRGVVAARVAVIDLRRERVAAWIALYRELGGGWSPTDTPPPSIIATGAAPVDSNQGTRDEK